MGKKHFCFFQTAETGSRTPDSGVKGSGANHYPRAPAPNKKWLCNSPKKILNFYKKNIWIFEESFGPSVALDTKN